MRNGDWAAVDAALADDLTYVHSTARLESKAEHIANLRARKPHYRSIAPRERRARVHGSVGIVTGVSETRRARWQGAALHRSLPGRLREGCKQLAHARLAIDARPRRLAAHIGNPGSSGLRRGRTLGSAPPRRAPDVEND
jgi:hypothetical protein